MANIDYGSLFSYYYLLFCGIIQVRWRRKIAQRFLLKEVARFCMKILDSAVLLDEHQEICCLPAPVPQVSQTMLYFYYHMTN